jgi:hypothetical protein
MRNDQNSQLRNDMAYGKAKYIYLIAGEVGFSICSKQRHFNDVFIICAYK